MKKLRKKKILVTAVCLLVSMSQVTGAYAMNVDDQGQIPENVNTNQQDQTVTENQQDQQSEQTREENQQDQSRQTGEETQQNQSSRTSTENQQNQFSQVVENEQSQNVQRHVQFCLPVITNANDLPSRTMSTASNPLGRFSRPEGLGKVEISQNINKKPQTDDGCKQCECCGKIRFKNKGANLPSLLTQNPHKIPSTIFLRSHLEVESFEKIKPTFSCDGVIEVSGGNVTLKNLDIHGYFRVTNNASLTLENCVLTHSSNVNQGTVAIECVNGHVDMKNCEVKDCLIMSPSLGQKMRVGDSFRHICTSTIDCDHCSFEQKMPPQDLSSEGYKAEMRKHQCSLLALKGGKIYCSECEFNSNVLQNTDIYANEEGLIELKKCKLNLNGSISRCVSIDGFIKIKDSSFGCGSFSKNSEVEICNCEGDNIFSQGAKVKIFNTQMQTTRPDKACFNFKNSEVECENVSSQNLVNQPIFFVTSSKVRGKNMIFAPSQFAVFAKGGSDILLTNHNISPFSNSIVIDSKISHTGVLNCKLVGTGVETILGSDQVMTKLDFKSQNMDLDDLIYSSNGIDTAKKDFIFSHVEKCAGEKLFFQGIRPCTKKPSISKMRRMKFFEDSMQFPCKKCVVDKFGKCFTGSIYLDDMNPLFLKHKSIFKGKADGEGRFACLIDAVGSRCPICLEEEGLNVVILPCRHVCHAECLNKNVDTCPVCRQKIAAKFFAH